MQGQVSGKFSSTDGMVSVPRVNDEDTSSSSSQSQLMAGEIDGADLDSEGEGEGCFEAPPQLSQTPRQSFGSKIGAAFSGGFGATSTVFATVNSAISETLRVSPKITSAFMSIMLAVCFATGGVVAYDWFNQPTPALWVGKQDCESRVSDAQTKDTDASSSDVADAEAAMVERGKKIYSVLKMYNPNLSNEHIAAVLSNWQWESGGLDETAVEGISDEQYHIGPKKQQAVDNIDSYTRELWGRYSGIQLDYVFYTAPDGVARCGIGLAQDTGPNAKKLIETAESMNHNWYDFDFQLAYIIAKGGAKDDKPFDPGHFDSFSGDATSLASQFCPYFEGIADGGEHSQYASAWLSRMSSWTVDTAYASSVIAMIENMGGQAAAKEVEEQKSRCPECASEEEEKYDNSGIAQAAVALAWPQESQASVPTEVYRKVLPGVFNGDTYYLACDRVALSSVRWSGADDDFPSCTGPQIDHMTTSPAWQKVGDNPSESQLQPGDVLIYDHGGGANGHVFIYTGHEIIEKVHGSKAASSANMVEGSLDTHAAHCDTYGSFDGFAAYRCIKPANSDKYKHVVDGYTFTNGKGKSDNKNCNRKKTPDNSDIARAAASLSYSSTVSLEEGYPGTALYYKVTHAVHDSPTNDGRACDTGASTAIRWCGYDTKFPQGLYGQHQYLNTGVVPNGNGKGLERWEFVGVWDGDESWLEPGDIVLYDGHISVFCGYEIVQEIYDTQLKGTEADLGRPTEKMTWANAGYHRHMPMCIASQNGPSHGGAANSIGVSKVYRCYNPEYSDKFKDVANVP